MSTCDMFSIVLEKGCYTCVKNVVAYTYLLCILDACHVGNGWIDMRLRHIITEHPPILPFVSIMGQVLGRRGQVYSMYALQTPLVGTNA